MLGPRCTDAEADIFEDGEIVEAEMIENDPDRSVIVQWRGLD